MNPQDAAMAIGVLGTSVIHLSKGMARHAVQKIGRADGSVQKLRARLFYSLSVVINHSNPIWIIWANLYAPPTCYTSMYGFGLVVLLLYSLFVLKEPLENRQVLGALIIVGATVALGLITRDDSPSGVYGIRTIRALLLMTTSVIVAGFILLGEARRTPGASQRLEIVIGVLAGLLACFDPVLKGVAQSGASGNSVLPTSPLGWSLYVASFIVALAAFLVTQWGFFRGCRASILVAAFNATYVTAPILVLLVSLPGYSMKPSAWVALVFVNAGILAVRSSSKTRPASAGEPG